MKTKIVYRGREPVALAGSPHISISKGNLVVVRDKRGEIIQHRASTSWLFENLENLRGIPVGAYFDKTCARVHPTGPKRYY